MTALPETHNSITILLPFYKEVPELDAAIESIAIQTFPHWTLLLISNNGSPESLYLAEAWSKKDKRIKLLHEQEQGIAYALNTGLDHCRSTYIARMDADDISHPERFERQFSFLEENPGIDVVSSQTTFKTAIPGSEARRCVGKVIRKYFTTLSFCEGKDFILAA